MFMYISVCTYIDQASTFFLGCCTYTLGEIWWAYGQCLTFLCLHMYIHTCVGSFSDGLYFGYRNCVPLHKGPFTGRHKALYVKGRPSDIQMHVSASFLICNSRGLFFHDFSVAVLLIGTFLHGFLLAVLFLRTFFRGTNLLNAVQVLLLFSALIRNLAF